MRLSDSAPRADEGAAGASVDVRIPVFSQVPGIRSVLIFGHWSSKRRFPVRQTNCRGGGGGISRKGGGGGISLA